MARYKHSDYKQLLMVPVSLEDQIQPGTMEYAIHRLIEERVNTAIFDEKYRNDETGRMAYNPKTLLKIVLFAYSRGIMQSRRIERACRENITFMALACGQAPDHSTLAAFVSSMGTEQIIALFGQILLVCEQEGLLGGTHFSLDGLKLSSNASKEWSGKQVDLLKKKEKLEQKVKEAIKEHRESDLRGGDRDEMRKQKRIKRFERQVKRIDAFLTKNKPKIGSQKKEIQSNVTDNESAKLTTSHGIVQGYNANAVVDSKAQVIVHAEAFGKGDDSSLVKPMLEGTKRNLKAAGLGAEALKGKIVSADTGYFSKVNLAACRDEQVDAYIPDRGFRNRDPRFAEAKRHRRSVDKHKRRYKSKRRWFSPDDFKIDDETGKLMCPAGKSLYKNGSNVEDKGYRGVAYKAPKKNCRNCHLRSKCLQNPNGAQRQVRYFHSKPTGGLANEMKQKIDTPEGRKIYSKRLWIVEPVFGNIRAQKNLDRFTFRGRGKVNIQWRLYCLMHNIEKILHFGKSFVNAA